MMKKAGRWRGRWRYALLCCGWWALSGLGAIGAGQAQQPVYWTEDFEDGWTDWTGQTSAFVAENGMARTDTSAAKAAL